MMNYTKEIPILPFKHFLTFDEVTDFVSELAAARPDLVTLTSIGTSREGRAIHLLTITDAETGKPEDKPAYLIHGNIHAPELSGTHAALYTARQLMVDHDKSDILKRVVFYIVPRINPDGAEFAVTTSGSIRSRTDRSEREANTLYQEDINGDGLILTMRQEHPDGSLVVDPKDPRLLIRRKKDSTGPFYRTLPEGFIHDWDGTDNIRVEGRSFDWNRNWSYDWRPEPEQGGAGDFPFSEPEMRAMAEFIHSHPNIFGVLGYHTGPGATLKPPSTGSDSDLDEGDVHVMDELAKIGSEHTGLPVYSVVKYHSADQRDINLRGHFHNFGYHHLGLFVFEFELGILKNSAGIKTEEILAAKKPEEEEEEMRRLMKWWDEQTERDEIYKPWTPFEHPQLGKVEIGGFLNRHLAGRTLPDLEGISKGTYQFTVEHASRHPRVIIEDVYADAVGGGVYRIKARIANRGHFPTNVSNKGRNLRRLRPVRVEFHLAPGVNLLSNKGHYHIGHIGGITDSRPLEWFVSAPSEAQKLCEIQVFGGTGGNMSVGVAK
ncbi:hypothetical protein FJZ31_29440 [Candidatus Poribacteria bacterium]|nr:hypothetical protein [Candidatus Poribacteria bacterium]